MPDPTDPDEIVERLSNTPLFGGLPREDLERLAALGCVELVQPGALLIREGEKADALFVVLSGDLEVVKRSGASEIPIDRVRPGSLQGDIASLEGGVRLASVRASTTSEVFRIPIEALQTLLASGPQVAMAIIGTAVRRLRGMEAALREREKLAGLGTLAAGVAHELNNPAAAALRSVAAIEDVLARSNPLDPSAPLPEPPVAREPPHSALERADRIRELAAIAGDSAATSLCEMGWTASDLRLHSPEVIGRVAVHAELNQLLSELRMAVERVSEIVGAVRGYAYLDQAPVQRVDLRIGIEQTLVILRHRLSAITLRRDVADDLPEIEVRGSELNQVWTNLIDNAVDAMAGRGELLLRAERDLGSGGVRVSVCDTGVGIDPPVRARLFEPFFTTKPPGKGTGLGLHISHEVVARHGGRIDVESEPGRTCFHVTLPRKLPSP